jgi:hypothetical protein
MLGRGNNGICGLDIGSMERIISTRGGDSLVVASNLATGRVLAP